MTERQLQFRVGIFVLVATVFAVGMIFRFGELSTYWERTYVISIHFDEAAGLHPSTPVFISGISIGSVRDVSLDQQHGGVLVLAAIREQYRLRADSQPRLVTSLLGDASIDFSLGTSREALKPGALVQGIVPGDPLSSVTQLAGSASETLEVLTATGREWRSVGNNLNQLLTSRRDDLDLMIGRSVESLRQFSITMQTANKALEAAARVFGDAEQQKSMQQAFAQLPDVILETHKTIVAMRRAVESGNSSLENLTEVTGTMSKRSDAILIKLDNSLGQMELLIAELNQFARMLSRKDGSLQKLVADPALYDNLNRSAGALAMLLKNLEQSTHDLRIFSDKIARFPELIGVAGALNGSSGLKELGNDANLQRMATPPQRGRARE